MAPDHLPECRRWFTDMPAPDECPACEMFRACEQRVRDEIEADGPWFKSVVHQCCEDKQTAYAAGLTAARDAVAALIVTRADRVWFGDALAAIDALRGSDV